MRVCSSLPTSIPCVWATGFNYKPHIEEAGYTKVPKYPVFTMKATSSILRCNPTSSSSPSPSSQCIVIPEFLWKAEPEVDYEGELAVVIGEKPVKNVTPQEVMHSEDMLQGVTTAMDISARKWQFEKGGNQFVYGKSFDTFCPLSTQVVTFSGGEPLCQLLPKLTLTTRVNGEVRQREKLSEMIFPVEFLVSFLSQGRTLLPGTIILTGTPAGVGFTRRAINEQTGKMEPAPVYLSRGDVVSCSIEEIGEIVCDVREESK